MILRADQVGRYFPGFSEANHAELWHAAEQAVKDICHRTFESATKTEYPRTDYGKVYPEDGPIAAAGLALTDLSDGTTSGTVLTADTRIGLNDADYVLMRAGLEGSYLDLHGATYAEGGLKLQYTGGYETGAGPETVKAAVGLAMRVLLNTRTSGGVGNQSVGGESYDYGADEWRQVRRLLAPYIRHAV